MRLTGTPRALALALVSAIAVSGGIILGPEDPAPETGDYIRLMPGQLENMIFDPARLFNRTFLNQLLDTHLGSNEQDPTAPAASSLQARWRHHPPPQSSTPAPAARLLSPRASEFVCNGAGPWASQLGVGRCAGVLLGLGNTSCATNPGDPAVLCDVREQGVRTVVRGLTLSGMNQTARCIDCANGVEWVARNCGKAERCVKKEEGGKGEAVIGTTLNTTTVCYLGGAGATTGNGNFIMYTYGDGVLV